jgi:hypothetical protein
MFRALFSRSRADRPAQLTSRAATGRGVETRPPQVLLQRPWSSRLGDWLGASGWRVSAVDLPSSFGQRARLEAVATARLDFADALCDVPTAEAAIALDRIAVARSLHELWHFRGQVFDEVSRRHDQAEAGRRLAALDRHFAERSMLARWRDPSGSAAARRPGR